LIAFEANPSMTGTNADRHFALRPGDELSVALAIANELIVQQKASTYASDSAVTSKVAAYTAAAVSKLTGVPTDAIKQAAADLWDARGRGLVVGGAVKGADAVALQVVVNLLNSVLDNDGATVDWSAAPSLQVDSSYADLQKLVQEMQQDKIAALIMHQTDPLFTFPKALGFDAALSKVPLVVTTADRVNASAAASDWVCPASHALESWGDANPQRGLYSITQPTIAPLHKTRSLQDSLIAWDTIGAKSWHDYLQAYWATTVRKAVGSSQTAREFWQQALQQGYVASADYTKARAAGRLNDARKFASKALAMIPLRPTSMDGLRLSLYPSVSQYDGRSPNNGWLQELPDPVSKISWENYLAVAPKTAKRLGVTDGDVVKVTSGALALELTVHRQPKMHEGAAAVAVGYGQANVGRVGSNVGVNVYPFQEVGKDFPIWSGQSIHVEQTDKTNRLALMQDHHTVEGRPLVREATFAELESDPAAGNHSGHHGKIPTMWKEFEYKGHKWGMSIDMSSCTGCSACMIGCQAENNVPIVGKDEVIRGRDMHWIRIDRYYSGNEENPDVTYQAMLCQHCDNAPCETVCPVLATIHNDEGLNVQAYNRCVGTRYCANNCPYKVRRFNYYDYQKQYVEPLNLVLNPDITVRSRGVMEKCSFCVQRIKGAKGLAKDAGRALVDGDVQTACQQSCPSNAIVFGDLNDKESKVAKQGHEKAAYHVLEELNVRPNITYMVKVRNV
jgi:Fe-S-cluster-containing dehydrogenase component